MTAITFDTLEFANQLKEAKVPDEQAQARALRKALGAALSDHAISAATKSDVASLRSDTDSEFALLRKDMEARFDMMQKEIDARFDLVNRSGG